MGHVLVCTRSYSTRESGRLPAEVTCGENDRCQVIGCVCVCVNGGGHTSGCSRVFEDIHIHTYMNNLPPCTLTLSHTSHVPRCEKDGKAPPAKSLPKLPEVSFHVCGVGQSEGLFPS